MEQNRSSFHTVQSELQVVILYSIGQKIYSKHKLFPGDGERENPYVISAKYLGKKKTGDLRHLEEMSSLYYLTVTEKAETRFPPPHPLQKNRNPGKYRYHVRDKICLGKLNFDSSALYVSNAKSHQIRFSTKLEVMLKGIGGASRKFRFSDKSPNFSRLYGNRLREERFAS